MIVFLNRVLIIDSDASFIDLFTRKNERNKLNCDAPCPDGGALIVRPLELVIKKTFAHHVC